jgi:hypothetical protein
MTAHPNSNSPSSIIILTNMQERMQPVRAESGMARADSGFGEAFTIPSLDLIASFTVCAGDSFKYVFA